MTISHPLRKSTLLLALAAVAAPAAASAQARVSIQVGLPGFVVPAVLPPLAVIEPGVNVVQDLGEEVFFVDGTYWARHDGGWYRAQDHRARWVHVEPRLIPRGLAGIPPGTYRYWHPGRPHHDWYRPYQWRRPQLYGPPRGEWGGAAWHRARPHDSSPGRRWTEARWSPPVREWHGRGHR